ncbi:ABC transporter permease [Spelaeicoccus albus]|uniref:Oligopeptide transport system permease protein n=1 Tax=Spelaeicoccus albus TaxID=1280376 RepID=A0A7Z0ACL3_9MICO|nr:ABC transporter permease [Spelaeicoccus albus]NYI66786.1 oligopeptide transport system permease protein [Spelaeicoccus albus]
MLRYTLRRLLQMIPVLIGATLLIYIMVFALPGDPVQALFGQRAPNPNVVAQIRANYHLDKPFLVQYLYFLKGLATGDFGMTFSGQPVLDIIARVFPTTIKLAFIAVVFEMVLGIFVGVIAGIRKGKIFDSTVLMLSLVVIAIPTFVLGFIGQFVFGLQLSWLPATARDASLYSLLMPGMVLGGVSLAYVIRLTRTSVVENLTADHVRTARAKGLSGVRVTTFHVLRNSLVPVVTFLGADLGTLMGGAIVTENIFSVDGVGHTLYDAIIRQEGTTVVSIVTLLVIVYIFANLAVDLLYAVLDPRIRYA